MTDERVILPNHSQQRQASQRNSLSFGIDPSRKTNMTTDLHYSNRNCPEILTLISLQNRQSENRQKQIYRAVTTDAYELDTVNYPIQSPPPTPIPPLLRQKTVKQIQQQQQQPQQTTFPKLTNRTPTTTTVKKFPTLTARSSSLHASKRVPMPSIRSSQKPVPSSSRMSVQTKMAVVSTYQRKRFQSSHHIE